MQVTDGNGNLQMYMAGFEARVKRGSSHISHIMIYRMSIGKVMGGGMY